VINIFNTNSNMYLSLYRSTISSYLFLSTYLTIIIYYTNMLSLLIILVD